MADITLHPAARHHYRPAGILARMTGWLHDIALRREIRRTAQELDHLSDHMLNDIGVTRHDVEKELDLDARMRAAQLRSSSPRIYL